MNKELKKRIDDSSLGYLLGLFIGIKFVEIFYLVMIFI